MGPETEPFTHQRKVQNMSRESLRLSRSFMFLCGSNRNSNSSQKAVDQVKPNLTRMALFKKIIPQTSDFNYNYIEACTNKGSRVYESKPWRSKFLQDMYPIIVKITGTYSIVQ
jgi:hypothetical protein